MVSYSQNREDVILQRVFADVPTGFYVDVGASDPNAATVTRHFYEKGWRGINLEPGLIFEKLSVARPRDINLNVAASDQAGTVLFHEFPDGPSLGTVRTEVTEPMKAFAARRYARNVPAVPLREILAEHALNVTIDFLNVDVEGHERAVLLGNDWERFRPRVVLVEATEPMTPVPNHHLWEDVLVNAGYLFAYFDGLNRFYVRKEDPALLERFSPPPNVFDNFVPWEIVALEAQVKSLDARLNDALVAWDLEKQQLAGVRDEVAQAKAAEVEANRLRIELVRERERDRDAATELVQRYRELNRNTDGKSLGFGLWIARFLCGVRDIFKTGPQKPKWPI